MSVTTTSWSQNLRALCSDDHPPQLLKAQDMNTPALPREEPTKLQLQLLTEAARVRAKIGPPSKEDLSFDSIFLQPPDKRGFCNWLITGRLLIGQYPGQNPLPDGPTAEACAHHLKLLTKKAKVSVFCSLQRETPAQDRDDEWDECGRCYLQPQAIRRQLPRPFTRYAPLVREYMYSEDNNNTDPVFLHAPLQDLSVPDCQEPLQRLLLELLQQLSQQKVIYIHCWGGRGRAGLVGACLLTLIWPQFQATTILNWVQRGYSTRAGHERLAPEYASSPQTCAQREYVRAFAQQYQALERQQQPQSSSSSSSS